jgi:hypothetical protein
MAQSMASRKLTLIGIFNGKGKLEALHNHIATVLILRYVVTWIMLLFFYMDG